MRSVCVMVCPGGNQHVLPPTPCGQMCLHKGSAPYCQGRKATRGCMQEQVY